MKIVELTSKEWLDGNRLNQAIRGPEEYLAYARIPHATGKEIQEVLEANPFLTEYDAVIFGAFEEETMEGGEITQMDFLAIPQVELVGFCVAKSIFQKVGPFQTGIAGGGTEYEFLCRLLGEGRAFLIPCALDQKKEHQESIESSTELLEEGTKQVAARQEISKEYAGYLWKIYYEIYKESPHLSLLLEQWLRICPQLLEQMEYVTEHEDEFLRLRRLTAPWFIIMGDQTCYGVLHTFAKRLGEELMAYGESVVLSDNSLGNYRDLSQLMEKPYKAIVGFQSPVLSKDFFKRMNVDQYLFYFDNPLFFHDLFHELSPKIHILQQDGDYARYGRDYYGIKDSIHFFPGGDAWKEPGKSVPKSSQGAFGEEEDQKFLERPLDLVFIGSYHPVKERMASDFEQGYYDYMIAHPQETFEVGCVGYTSKEGEKISAFDLTQYYPVCKEVVAYYRHKVMETLLASGIEVHVYGDSWKDYPDTKGRKNLVIHPALSVEESLHTLSLCKCSLNVMTWHKNGMTERIANSMANGAICITDETTYLKFHFDEECMLQFSLEDLESLPGRIRNLFEDAPRMEAMSKRAREIAMKEYTWEKRSLLLLEKVNQDVKFGGSEG
ncbi:MAG: glycosyltransferase [Lachnospiraceae bacterium]|nr:glycosyltransferase [Lachnospiraceae bacterium]